MRTRRQSHFIFWSNGFFLIPLFFAIYHHVYPHAIIIGLATFVSGIYHFYHERALFRADKVTAWLLMFTNLGLIWLAGFPLFYTALTFATAGVAIYFHAQKNAALFTMACGT